MEIEKLIEKKKEEILSDVVRHTVGMEKRIVDGALIAFSEFEEQLKMAYAAKVIGPEDLLRVIEKDGFIYRKIVDTADFGRDEMQASRFLEALSEKIQNPSVELEGKQKVTIIIEPWGM